MKLKKGDNVKVLAGKDKGKTGKILQVFVSRGRASVEGINLLIKHMRPRKQGEKGQRIEFPSPIDMSNLILVCANCSQPTRVGYKKVMSDKEGVKEKKIRICKKCRQTII
jgi:large subunit ribosomal protein L24